MKTMLALLLFLLFSVQTLYSQKGQKAGDTTEFAKSSNVMLERLTAAQVENLSLLGKVWGFLKYYHPVVAEGYYNWDYELFRLLPAYIRLDDKNERDAFLVHWINSLGTVTTCKKCNEETKNEVLKPDLDWISSDQLSDSLKVTLEFIRRNRHQGKSYYVQLVPRVGNANIMNENAYPQFLFPDTGYRLLALFRYWNVVQYWFPDRHLIGEDWKAVLTQFIPRFIGAANEVEYWNTFQQLIARIHDSHANLLSYYPEWNNRFGKYYPPFLVSFVGNDPVVSVIVRDSLARLSNIQRGDIIKSVNGKKVADIITESLPNLPASNYATQLRDLAIHLLTSKDSITDVTVERDGQPIEAKLHHFIFSKWSDWYHYDFPYQKDSSFFFIAPGVGYINLGKIKKNQVDSVFKLLQGSKGLIIDNRQYPSDFVIYDIAENLNPDKTPFVKFPVANLDYPGSFTVTKSISAGKKNKDYYKGKVVILVNENTQSSAEFHAMAFRTAPDASVLGSTTAGADGNVTNFFYLPGGLFTRFSGIGIWYPDGTETQRVGIVSDIEVKRTVKGIKEGRDELVEKAIEVINAIRKPL
jgi:hypothetical protein